MTTELTAAERGNLQSYEAIIEDGLQSFVEVGTALMQIRDGKLYRDSHGTFEAYCKERWQLPRSHAYRFIDGAKVVRNVQAGEQTNGQNVPHGRQTQPSLTAASSDTEQVAERNVPNWGQTRPILPSSESQARELAAVPAADQPAVWQEAVDTAPRDKAGKPKPTAKHVREVVQRRSSVVDPMQAKLLGSDPPSRSNGKPAAKPPAAKPPAAKPPGVPIAETLAKSLEGLKGRIDGIYLQYGSAAAMFDSDLWQGNDPSYVITLVSEISETIQRLDREMKDYENSQT